MIVSVLLGTAVATASPLPRPLLAPPVKCGPVVQPVRQDQEAYFERLGRLPPGGLEYAVARTIDGCPVPAPVGYHPPPAPRRK